MNDGKECSCVSMKIRMTMNRFFFFPKKEKCSEQITSVDPPQQTNNNCLGEGHVKNSNSTITKVFNK